MSDASNIPESDRNRPLRQKVDVQQLDLLVGRLDSLPPSPGVVAGVLNLIAAGAGLEQLAAVVGSDPAVAACLLSRACVKRPNRPPRSIEEAVDILGAESVRSAVLDMKVLGDSDFRPGGLDYEGFRTHCTATACAAELLVPKADGVAASTAFMCGLLHDLGKAAMNQCLPGTYRRVLAAVAGEQGNIAQFEREIIGIDHTVAGRRLAQHWSLPACVADVIWLHHQPVAAIPPTLADAGLVVVVQLADMIVRRGRLGFSGNFTSGQDSGALAAEVGLSAEDIEAVAAEVPSRLEDRLALVGPAGSHYRSALAEVGAELAHLNEALAGRAEALGRYADALSRLGEFAAVVSPASALPKMCEEIARMFSAVLSVGPSRDAPVCAFAACNDARLVLAVCSGPADAGKAELRFSSSRPECPLPPAGVCPAGAMLRALLAEPGAWSDLIDLDSYACVPLLAEGRLVGGVLLPEGCAVRHGGSSTNADSELLETLSRITAFILAAVGGRGRADRLAEQLAGASQRLDEAQDALAHSRALAAVGEMSAGAAHEMNNPLAVISGRAQLLAGRVKTKKDRESAELIAAKAQEISDIMTDLMAFARPSPPRPGPVDVADLLERAKNRFESEWQQKPPPATVDIKVGPTCPSALADAGQMEEVLAELLRNAAIAADGKVNVSIRAEKAASAGVLIRVADDGPGMDEETLGSAFTPFFSHRQAGRGRGMGLTRARRSVESNGGRMWIESTPGKGATVFVELPAAQKKAPKQ